MKRILYIAYWGALEPLGRSLIVPSVIQMAKLGAKISLVTFEKPDDLDREKLAPQIGPKLKAAGICWLPKSYHKSPQTAAKLFDFGSGIASGLYQILREPFDIVHGRCFIGGLIGMVVAKLAGKKFIYHNEGFYPDEQVDGGIWTRKSKTYRIAKYLEDRMYGRADGIIALSQRAVDQISNFDFVRPSTEIIKVPSCVDLEHFSGSERRTENANDVVKLVYIGSVGGRYTLDQVGRFVAAINRVRKRASLSIFSKADPKLVSSMLKDGGLVADDWTLSSVSYDQMPEILKGFDAGLFFLQGGTSEQGCSPTKVGEYWASGMPVVTTPRVSDIDEIILQHRVGAIIESHSERSYVKAFDELERLLLDPDLPHRCRMAAEEHYDTLAACERQLDLYDHLLEKR